MVIQVTFLTRCEPPMSGLATHVRDPARATMPTSLTLNSFLSLPPCQRWTLPKRFSGLHKGSFWNQGDWSIMLLPVIHHVLPKSTLFSLQGEGDTVSKNKTNTCPLSGRWSDASSSFYIFLALQLQWKFPEIFWSIWFSKSSESMALTADPILVSFCVKEKEIEFRQKGHENIFPHILVNTAVVRKDHQSCNSDALTVKSYGEINSGPISPHNYNLN